MATKVTTQPLATVQQYIDAFNKGDVKAMAECFASPASILDGMPPHLWQGSRAAEDWYRDVLTTTKKEGATEFFVSLGEPLHTDTTDDAAYIVVSATMSFKVHGKHVTQSGAVFTLALRQVDAEWRIAAWAWAKGTG